jgi:acyl-CoA hydrolase
MNWHDRIIAADEAAALVKSGNRIFLTGNCSTPRVFLEALVARHETLEHVEVVQLLDFNPEDVYYRRFSRAYPSELFVHWSFGTQADCRW